MAEDRTPDRTARKASTSATLADRRQARLVKELVRENAERSLKLTLRKGEVIRKGY